MLQLGGDFDLTEEAVRPERRGEVRLQDLDRHLAVVLQVLGEIDRGHPAGTELALDCVSVGEGGLQTGEEIGQAATQGCGTTSS